MNDTTHITTLEGMRESYEVECLENSNLRKLLFEAVKRLAPDARKEIVAMVKDKTLAEGGFTSVDWGAAEEFDKWKNLFDRCADLLQEVIDAPGQIISEHNPRGSDVIFHQPKIQALWFAKADQLASQCRAHGQKMQREKTLEELLDNRDH